MRTLITLVVLATGSLLFNKLQAQNQNINSPTAEADNYDTFSAIYDETGFKADVYRGHVVPAVANHKRIHFIETWIATETWKALTGKEQVAYLQALDAPDRFMLVDGVKIIRRGDDQLTNVDFFTIWSVSEENSENGFELLEADSKWNTYFYQVNVQDKDSVTQEVMVYLFRH